MTEDDLKILEKLYLSHEINRIISLGKYYVLLDNIEYFVDEKGKLKADTIYGNYKDMAYMFFKHEDGRFHFISWDNVFNHKIVEYDTDSNNVPEWVKKLISAK